MPDRPAANDSASPEVTPTPEPSSRRGFLKHAAAGFVGGTLGATTLAACGSGGGEGGGPAVQTNQRVRWNLASSFPRSLDTIYGAADTLANRVEALTEGRFTIRIYPAGEMVPFNEVLQSVQKRTIQIGHSASYYYKGLNPALVFDTCVPFGLTARQYIAWMYEGGGMDVMRPVFSDFGVVNLPGGNTGTQMGGWFRRRVDSLSALRGIKMRIPGLGGEVMDRLGVSVQVLGGSEIYPALERGAIDATEWVGPYDDEKLGFHEVAPHYYYPGWWEPGAALSFYINQSAWDELPSLYREALTTAAKEATITMLATYDAKNPAALARLIDQGTDLRPFPKDIMDAARDASIDLMEQAASADASYRTVYDAFKGWRDQSQRWFATAEQAYAQYAFPTGGPA